MVCCAMAAEQDKANVNAKVHRLFNGVVSGCLNKCMIIFKNQTARQAKMHNSSLVLMGLIKKAGLPPLLFVGCADLAQLEHKPNLLGLGAIPAMLPCRAKGAWSRCGTNEFITQNRESMSQPRRSQRNPARGKAVV